MSEMNVPPLPTAEEFAGKVAVVTGGTNGLGWHLSGTLVKLGAEVFFCGRQAERGHALVKEWGPRAHFVQTELSDVKQVQSFAKQAGEFRGRIDYLVNNAAVDPRIPFATAPIEEFDRIVAINLRSYFVMTQASLPYLLKGEGKAIVNISTTNYYFGYAGMTIYNSAKAGILGFSRSLARELGEQGIRVNVVTPGWIRTEKQVREHGFDQAVKELVESQCVRYPLSEQHVTPVTLFLLSKASAGISGQSVVVDGGKAMQ
jgi:NAD(P)-dependent dehydrogenase (short-subunit alcohol dehydrogenase family)